MYIYASVSCIHFLIKAIALAKYFIFNSEIINDLGHGHGQFKSFSISLASGLQLF